MKAIFRFLRSVPSMAHWIGAVTLAVWIIKAVWFDGAFAKYEITSALGRVVDGIFSAVVAGYLFYILFALLPDYQARSRLSPYVFGKVRGIVGDCMGVLDEVGHASSMNLKFVSVQQAQIKSAFASVLLANPPRLLIGNSIWATWMQFFEYRQRRSQKSISDLFVQSRFLDVDLVSLLTEISDCPFFMQVAASSGMPVSNSNLSAWAPSFVKYLESCRKLAEWHDKHQPTGTLPLLAT